MAGGCAICKLLTRLVLPCLGSLGASMTRQMASLEVRSGELFQVHMNMIKTFFYGYTFF